MTDSSDATVMNPGKGEQGQRAGPLPSPRRTPAQSWSRRCPFWLLSRHLRDTETSWARSGAGPGPEQEAAGCRGTGTLLRIPVFISTSSPPTLHHPAVSGPRPSASPGAAPMPGSRRAPPPPRRGGSFPFYLQIPAGACCRSRPTACRGCEWCFPSRGPPRRLGPPAPSRCCGERRVPPSASRFSPPARPAPVGESRAGEAARWPLAGRSALRGCSGVRGDAFTHLIATQTQAMSKAMPQVCARTLRCPRIRHLEQVWALILPLSAGGSAGWGRGARLARPRPRGPRPRSVRAGRVGVAVAVRTLRFRRRSARCDRLGGGIRVWRDGARSESSDNNRIRH